MHYLENGFSLSPSKYSIIEFIVVCLCSITKNCPGQKYSKKQSVYILHLKHFIIFQICLTQRNKKPCFCCLLICWFFDKIALHSSPSHSPASAFQVLGAGVYYCAWPKLCSFIMFFCTKLQLTLEYKSLITHRTKNFI